MATRTPIFRPTRSVSAHRQRGISLLVVSLLMMAIVLMTLTAFYISRTQYKLVGNIQASELAFSRAESAIAAAESWLNGSGNSKAGGFDSYDATATPHLYPAGQLATLGRTPASMTWSNTNSTVSGDGRYLVELVGRNVRKPGDSIALNQRATGCKAVDLFRVLAKADTGQSGSRIIETIEATDGC
jgi:Tfp pilus assembly protein PilX